MATSSAMARVTRTFLFTDLERSTRLWEQQPEVMTDALLQHLGAIAEAVEARGGTIYSDAGDGLVAVFDDPGAAVMAAADAQRLTMALESTPLGRLRSRMGVHTGSCFAHGDRYSGQALNRCARLHAAGHGTQVLVSGSTAVLVESQLAPGYRLIPLGEYWLRDLRDAELVFQLAGPSLPSDFPPIHSRRTSRDRLPAELTPLVGRNAELQALLERLRSRSQRLTVLTGEAGVGKTRLALRAADETWWTFRDGVHWLDVAASVGESVAAGLAGRVGVPLGRAGLHESDELARALTTNELLLVLDNCEADVRGVARLVTAVLAECPDVVVLATSREPLGVAGEVQQVVRPLASEVPADLEPAPAVRLFLSRAAAARPDLDANADVRRAAQRIVAALGGIPLAIEQAAASLDVLTIDDLESATTSDHLERMPGFERVTASIERSVALLAPEEAALLTDLAIFRSAFTATAVAEVCFGGHPDPAELTRRLADLARKSLIQPASFDAQTRYSVSEPLRAWARTRRPASEALIERYHVHHRRVALDAGVSYRHGDQRRAVDDLGGSWDDIRATVSALLAAGDLSSAAQLVVETHEFCLFSLRPDVYLWADRVAGRLDDSELDAAVTGISALGAWQRGEMNRALATAGRAIDLHASPAATKWAHRAEMNTLSYLGRMDEVGSAYLALLGALRASAEPFWEVDRLASESIGYSQIGAVDRAIDAARRASRLAEETGNQDCLYWSHHALGLSLAATNPVSARSALERAIEEADSIGSLWNANNARLELLVLQRRQGGQQPFDIEAAQIAWELLGRFDRARSTTQVWQVVVETAWMLAVSGFNESAADLYRAVMSKPRMPRPDGLELDRQVRRSVAGGRDVVGEPAGLTETFQSERWIIERCRDGLAMLLGVRDPSP